MKITIRHAYTKKVDESGNLRIFVNYDFKETSKLSTDMFISLYKGSEKLIQVKTNLILIPERAGKRNWNGFVYFDIAADLVRKMTDIKWKVGPFSGQCQATGPFEDLTKINLKTPSLKSLFDQIVNN